MIEVGDKVKVVKPCFTSNNKKGLIGFVTEVKKKAFLSDFDCPCFAYKVCKKPDCKHSIEDKCERENKSGWWEHESGIELIEKAKK